MLRSLLKYICYFLTLKEKWNIVDVQFLGYGTMTEEFTEVAFWRSIRVQMWGSPSAPYVEVRLQ